MNEILSVDVDVDWIDGLDEPSDLIWIGDGWSLADSPVGTAVQCHEVVSGLDSQGCSIPRDDFELEQLFNIGERSPVAVFAQREGHLREAVAA